MNIKIAAVEEQKKVSRKSSRYFCDEGEHWVTMFGVNSKPAVVAQKNGMTFRSCGQPHKIEQEKKAEVEKSWCQAKLKSRKQCTRKTAPKDSVFCKQHREAEMNAQVKKDLKKVSEKSSPKKSSKPRISSTNKIIISLVKKNPYRPGAQRTKAFELLIKAGSKGVSYSDFVKAHGLVSDGAKKGFLKVEVAK